MKTKPYFWVSSVEKCFRIIEELSRHNGIGVSDLAAHVDMDRSAAFRFLATLKDLGYVSDEKGKYRTSYRIFELGMRWANSIEVKKLAVPFMYELSKSHNETVNLGMLVDNKVIFIEKVEPAAALRTDLVVGFRFDLYCTALGKAILAHLPRDMRDNLIAGMELKPISPNTITDKDRLSITLREIRGNGYAVDLQEFDAHIVCVAAPVFTYSEYPTYAISLAGPVSRMTPDRVAQIGQDLVKVCARLSAQLGGGRHLNKEW
ncbi:MAG: IclR family transcriptional regulator [Desulfobacterales bacterium]